MTIEKIDDKSCILHKHGKHVSFALCENKIITGSFNVLKEFPSEEVAYREYPRVLAETAMCEEIWDHATEAEYKPGQTTTLNSFTDSCAIISNADCTVLVSVIKGHVFVIDYDDTSHVLLAKRDGKEFHHIVGKMLLKDYISKYFSRQRPEEYYKNGDMEEKEIREILSECHL